MLYGNFIIKFEFKILILSLFKKIKKKIGTVSTSSSSSSSSSRLPKKVYIQIL